VLRYAVSVMLIFTLGWFSISESIFPLIVLLLK